MLYPLLHRVTPSSRKASGMVRGERQLNRERCEVYNMPSILLHHIWAGLGRYFSYILYPISPKDFPNDFLDKHGRIDINFFMYECFICVSS